MIESPKRQPPISTCTVPAVYSLRALQRSREGQNHQIDEQYLRRRKKDTASSLFMPRQAPIERFALRLLRDHRFWIALWFAFNWIQERRREVRDRTTRPQRDLHSAQSGSGESS